jgi:hypothetical protein
MPVRRGTEAGKGALSTIFWLAVLAAGVYAGLNVIPIYMDHYSLKDKMTEMCRLPRYRNPDDEILNKIMKEVRERRMDAYILPGQVKITTRDTSRAISIDYDREAKYLPFPAGIKKTHFSIAEDQPIPF